MTLHFRLRLHVACQLWFGCAIITVGLNQHLECYSWWWGWAFRSPFQPKWWFFKLWFFKLWAVPLIPVPCQLGSKLHGETAESTSLGLCNSPGPHCWLFQVQMFWLTRGRKTRQPWGCVCPQLVGQWQGGWSTSLHVSVGLGHGGWGLVSFCLPDLLLLPPALVKPSQYFHLSWFFEHFTFLLFFHFISCLLLLF